MIEKKPDRQLEGKKINISIDTRTLQPGDIFIPIKGETFDGHDYIHEAIQKGASKIMDEPIGSIAKRYRKKLNCPVIAITGSYGKTTVKELLESVLGQKYTVVATQGNQNNEIGVPLTLLKGDSETDVMIVECGMRKKGDMQWLSRIVRPTHVLITGIGVTHMEFFESTKAIAKEKAQIFQAPLSHEKNMERKAYINCKSLEYERVKRRAESKGYSVYAYGGKTGIEQNMNAIYSIAREFELTDDEIKTGLKKYTSKEHRLEKIEHKGITIVDDTYNSNPDSVVYAINYINALKAKRKLCVLGDMLELGHVSELAHRQVIESLLNSDISVIFTIGKEMQKVQRYHPNIIHCNSKEMLHELVGQELKTGDLILLKGSRGMALEDTVDHIVSQV